MNGFTGKVPDSYLECLKIFVWEMLTAWGEVPELWRDFLNTQVKYSWWELLVLIFNVISPILLPLSPLLAWRWWTLIKRKRNGDLDVQEHRSS